MRRIEFFCDVVGVELGGDGIRARDHNGREVVLSFSNVQDHPLPDPGAPLTIIARWPWPEDTPLSAYTTGPIWHWFGLSYSAYLVLPRTLLCGMPDEWQERMVDLLEEMQETYDTDEIESDYQVTLRGEDGRYLDDPLADYRHPPDLPYRTEVTDS